MTTAPLVSVVVPVHDGGRYLADTLDAALAQTYPRLEVIVVDDGSADESRGIAESRAARDARVRVIAQSNRGVAAARNRAIAESTGEFIAPLDADDLWEPTKIERQVRRMAEAGPDTGLVYTWWLSINPEGAVFDASPRWRIEGEAADELLQINFTGNASVPLFRRREVVAAGGYDESLRRMNAEGCEDLDLALKISERASVAVEPAWLTAYRRHPAGMSAGLDRMWRSHSLVLEHARRRGSGVSRRRLRRARDQFALYLAGVSFLAGDYRRACGWGARALRSGLAFEVLPHVARGVVPMAWRRPQPARQFVAPGVRFGDWPVSGPRIPYDHIYAGRF